jgi:hypothetical protein
MPDESSLPTPSTKPDPLTKPDIVVKPLVDLWTHQNSLMWSRIQLLSALQGAALVANYALKNPFASLAIFLMAIVFTLNLYYIWEVDRLVRNSYRDRLNRLGFTVALDPDKRSRLRVPIMGIPIPYILPARISLTAIFGGMIVLDLVVLAISLAVFKVA